MTKSMLAAIRDGVAGAIEHTPDAALGGNHSQNQEVQMSETTKPTPAAGISQADHDAAVATARSEGHEAGFSAAQTRLASIMGAEGIKGDGKRMSAALDLATKSPGMSAEDVTSFVAGNVAAATSPADGKENKTSAQTYEERRLSAAGGLAQPDGGAPKRSGLSARIDRHANRG